MKRQKLSCLLLFLASPVLADIVPETAAAYIDTALEREYAAAQTPRGMRPLPLNLPPEADDATFLRRACIDLAGRLPRPEEAKIFLTSASPIKRAALTDALVREPAAAETRFRMLAETFRVKDDAAVIAWLRQAALDDRPYDQIITYMVGEGHMSRRDAGNAYRTAVETAFAVVGEDMHCSHCHDNPYNDHLQMEAFQFAACFTTNDELNNIRLPSTYWYRDGKPGDRVKPKLLRLSREAPPAVKAGKDQLMLVAQWLTKESSRRFVFVEAMRVWSSLFGMPGQHEDRTVGGSDPAPSWEEVHENSDIQVTFRKCYDAQRPNKLPWVGLEPSSLKAQNVEVALADVFRHCGYRIGVFQSVLARTRAYGRMGVDPDHSGYMVPAPHIRRLPAEVIWDALSAEKSAQLPQVPPLEHPPRMLGRGTREWSDESITPISHELARFMMNSPDVQLAASGPADRSTEDLFLSILGRYPNGLEKAISQQHRNEAPLTADSDIAWALLNTREFMFRP
jgi:hypothetical protein